MDNFFFLIHRDFSEFYKKLHTSSKKYNYWDWGGRVIEHPNYTTGFFAIRILDIFSIPETKLPSKITDRGSLKNKIYF